jgi:hypothetical protein
MALARSPDTNVVAAAASKALRAKTVEAAGQLAVRKLFDASRLRMREELRVLSPEYAGQLELGAAKGPPPLVAPPDDFTLQHPQGAVAFGVEFEAAWIYRKPAKLRDPSVRHHDEPDAFGSYPFLQFLHQLPGAPPAPMQYLPAIMEPHAHVLLQRPAAAARVMAYKAHRLKSAKLSDEQVAAEVREVLRALVWITYHAHLFGEKQVGVTCNCVKCVNCI